MIFADLEGDNLYSIKWYRNGHEFYRYIPSDHPQTTIFNGNGINVDVSKPKIMTIIEVGCFLRAEFRAEFWRKSWRISLPSAWLKKKWPKYLKNAPPKSGIIDVGSSFFGTYSITFPVGIMSEKQTGQWDKYLKKSSRISKEFKKPTGFSDRKIKADGFRLSSWIYNFPILTFNFWKFRFVISKLVVGSG